MNQNQKVLPKLFVRSTGASLKLPVTTPSTSITQTGNERRVFVVKSNTKLPAIAVSTTTKTIQPKVRTEDLSKPTTSQPQTISAVKEVKEEPLDEDVPGAVVNITDSKPINLQDFMAKLLPIPNAKPSHAISINLQNEAKDVSPEKLCMNSQPVDIASALNQTFFKYANESSPQKRTRKPTRHDDFVYDQPELRDDADDFEKHEPVAKQSRISDQLDSCRCEYIVPELERKMERIMDKMHFIETLAKSMLSRENLSAVEKNTELANAQNEIQQLRRQLIIQRNQKSLSKPEI